MSDFDTQTRMARLRECFPDNETLADHLGIEPNTVVKIANGTTSSTTRPDVQQKTRKLHEQIKKEHTVGLDAVCYALQTIERIRAGTMTDEHLDNVQQVLEQKADELNSGYA
jgi:hypothetical protein